MLARFKNQATINGWIYFGPSVANWGTDYVLRALCNMLGPGWNLPADAVYPASEKASDGKDYDGNNKYVIHFEKGQMPPVNGFWSLTMYDANHFFVPNALNRYTLSQRDNLVANATVQWTSIFRRIRPARTKRRIGCPRQKGNSASCCVCTGRRTVPRRSLTALGSRRQFKLCSNRSARLCFYPPRLLHA